MITKFEAALAHHKYERDFYFYPLDKVPRDYYVSPQFACAGLWT